MFEVYLYSKILYLNKPCRRFIKIKLFLCKEQRVFKLIYMSFVSQYNFIHLIHSFTSKVLTLILIYGIFI